MRIGKIYLQLIRQVPEVHFKEKMMSKFIGVDAAKLAGLQIDTLQKLRNGQLTVDQWERFNNLSLEDREIRFGGMKEQQSSVSILELVGTVVIRAASTPLVASERFVVNTKQNATVKISFLWNNFSEWFLTGNSKTEAPIMEQTLRYHTLRKASLDGSIITALGGAERAEMGLSHVFSLMEAQGKGEDGVLLTNGYANIFYVKDRKGVLRTVYVYWHDDGWNVNAYSVEDPDRWGDGDRVFSRNCDV
ncbi:MAG: hypothetical protein AAB343_04325 [Patescibacteria group bacterium]